MERQLSRRRRPANSSNKPQSERASTETSTSRGTSGYDSAQKGLGTKNNKPLVVILILVFVLSVFLGYFRSYYLVGLQLLYNPWRSINGGHHSNNTQKSHPPLQLNIQLHPEEHAGRPPTTHYLHWRVNSGYRRPDGVRKDVFLINGERFLSD
jgi:hypothetical protein